MEDFTDYVVEEIEKFFLDESASVLTLFYDEQHLVAQLTFPEVEIDDLMYFVKEDSRNLTESTYSKEAPVRLITPENFHESVIFGTIDCLAEGSILSIVETVFAPIFLNIDCWPDGILLL